MQWFNEFGRRLRRLLRRGEWENDLAEEMQLHMELRAAEKSAEGARQRDAEAEARRRFGNATVLRENSRSMWGWAFLDTLSQDLRYSLRTLAANKGFAAAAILSLMLGIGANTAIFSMVNAVMLRTLPVEDPRRLVDVLVGSPPRNSVVTNPLWEAIRDSQHAFSGVLAYSGTRFDLASGGESHFANGTWVSGDYFRVLGVPAIRGRVFTTDDDRHGGGTAGPVAVISYSFWQSHYMGDPSVIGRTISLDRHNFEIVGVTPPWFRGLVVDAPYDVAIPIGCEPLLNTDLSALNERAWWWLRMVGRLLPGESYQQATARLDATAPEIMRSTLPTHWDPSDQQSYRKWRFGLESGATGFSLANELYRVALITLMAVVGLVLLIACANIANLLLARATARQREISIRLAIGASRSRIIRQLLTESLLLAILGAGGGLAFSIWGSGLLLRLLSNGTIALTLDLSPDRNVLAFTAGIAILTGLLFGLAPALRATRGGPQPALQEHARGSVAGGSRFALGKALVTGQVALSLVLVAAAGLFVGTLRNLLNVDTGFDTHGVLFTQVMIPPDRIQKDLRVPLFQKMLADLRRLPGVESASTYTITPVSHEYWNNFIEPEGYQPKSDPEDTLVYFNRVSPGYFKTMKTPLLLGRDFNDGDTLARANVMIIGEATARHFWGSANPIGRTAKMRRPGEESISDVYQVIGVVKDVKYHDLDESLVKTGFFPAAQDQRPESAANFVVRVSGPIDTVTPGIRSIVTHANPDATLAFRTFDSRLDDVLAQPRTVALLSAFFGVLALLLAAIGLYGVISYTATRRRAEIGIRMALGAAQWEVTWLVLRDVVIMLAIGTGLGVAISIATSRFVKSLLFGVKPADFTTLAVAALILCSAASIAAFIPARRASRMDPMAALREE